MTRPTPPTTNEATNETSHQPPPANPRAILLRTMDTLRGVGPRRAELLRSGGIRCVADLLRHLPFRYESVQTEASLDGLIGHAERQQLPAGEVTVRGEIASARLVRGRKSRYEATLEDGSGTIKLTWFNAGWLRDKIVPGLRVEVTGKATTFGSYLQMVNPKWSVLGPADAEIDATPGVALRPVYPAISDLGSSALAPLVEQILDDAARAVEDHLPPAFRSERGLPRLAEAYLELHRPSDEESIRAARRRLAYDELLFLQLAVMRRRRERHATLRAPELPCTDTIRAHIAARLPFTLTDDQQTVVEEIVADLAKPTPMNRLLQGDVGAGKTVVAMYAALLAVAAGAQAALMAPTEVLAEQHFESISRMLDGSDVTIELFTGSLTAAARRSALERIESGEAQLVIGTHALLTETVSFRELALVIIDEQHRFGVHQRATLRTKGGGDGSDLVPHVLVMTATPIPRTLSLTVFGDLDVSTIRHLPPGRTPIATRAMPRARATEVYAYLAERLAGGEQAYIVVPVIDESTSGLTDVQSHLEWLRSGPLAALRVDAVHGRLKRGEREAIMTAFRSGELDALVATTVIEVGVDVPNASLIVIEHAERFGLAQLHQLRGRVGRGTRKSLCVLIGDPTTDDGRARLDALVESTDGFRIAERDLEIRGPGELFGARQSGIPPFEVAVLPKDFDLLRLARRDAIALIDTDPELDRPEHALMRERLRKAYGQLLGLGDVG